MQSPVFWGVFCGGIYFLVMWWLRTQRLNQQRQATRALYALSEEVIAASTPSGIAEKLADALPQLMESATAHLYLIQRDTQKLNRVATNGSPAAEALTDAVTTCFRNRTLLMVPDTRNNSLVKNVSETLPRSVLLLPLVSHEEALGVMQIDRTDRAGAFALEDQAAAQHLANQVASALKLQEQKALREQLFRGEKLAAAGHMIAGIAGELRSPIDSISKMSADISAILKRRDDIPSVEAGLERVLGESKRAKEILSRLSSFTGEANSAPRHLDLGAMLRKLAEFREPAWQELGLQGQRKFDAGSVSVLGAEGQLEQVFLTLLMDVERRASNSTTREVFLKTNEASGNVRVEIGYSLPAGMEPESGEAEMQDGALSLDVCSGIAQTHGGEIKVHRRPGVFAYEVLLPSVGRVMDAPRATEVAQDVRPLTLMLVDHEPGASRPLLKLLSSRGHRVVPVAGEEAVDVAPRLRFDAVFWTARAGRGGWSEFLDRVKASVGTFVLISDGYNQELATSLEQSGGFLLARPVEEASLDRILGEIGGRGR
ncbi:MAG: GAF domain-containing protein [Bryobacteraceae bacterium]